MEPKLNSANHRQATLVAALCDPARYPHAGDCVEHLQTHISHILLVGDYAYKIKKPLDLGFLDFTSLAHRKIYCEEELRLNRRLAPDIYMDCIPICGSVENPILDGDPANAVEYAVKMRRFPQSALLDRSLASGVLELTQIDRLAKQLADFHESVARAPTEQPFGCPEQVQQPALDNFTQTRPLLEASEDLQLLNQLEQWTITAYRQLQPILLARKTGGFIRECHGDLHLGNMLLQDGQITVFDCIEFNDEFRWIDVMSDLGFLLMDLHHRQAPALAWRLLNDYLECSGDYAGLAMLPYYQIYRALVRAKIAAIRANQAELGSAARTDAEAECRSYLRLARQFTQAHQPFLLITHGVSGSGKSTITTQLLATLGAIRIRSDVERKRLFGLKPLEGSDSTLNQGLYTADAGAKTYERLQELCGQIVGAGYPVLVDATFLQLAQRQAFRELADSRALPFVLLACTADPAILRDRVEQRKQRGEDAAEADVSVLEQQLRHSTAPTAEEHPLQRRWFRI
ncbi:MAG: AAA family ATPase [Candidatus Competibacteraceae bacterium]|nr:AAA family ATPase [Candidatus Competibacteraceae bacterium]